jgi:K+-sensing histidine kinase KdpD
VLKHISPTLGAGLCAAAAACLTFVFDRASFKALLPLLFLAFIYLTATTFGHVAGILGTIIAAAIFATFLFEPIFSLGVNDNAQRGNLIWMIVGGLVISDLFGGPPHSGRSHTKKT